MSLREAVLKTDRLSRVKVNIGDLQSEESRDIVLELSLDAVSEPSTETPQPVLNASVDYFNVVTNTMGSAKGNLGVLRPGMFCLFYWYFRG